MDGKWEVFETPDVSINVEDTVEEVERASSSEDVVESGFPSAEQVFEVFAGKRFVVESSTREKKKAVIKETESPFEKFNRLRIELEELAEELAVDSAGDLSHHSQAYEMLAQGIQSLQSRLSSLQQSRELVKEPSLDAARALSQARAHSLAEQLKPSTTPEEQGRVGLKYELYFPTTESHASDELLQRVSRLEKVLGVPSSSGRPLSEVVAQLEARMYMLDESKLSALAQKAKLLTADVEELARVRQRRGSVAHGEKDLQGVLDKLSRCDEMAESLPVLVERLRTVQEIHQHNANVHMRLEQIDSKQTELEEANRLDRQLLENLKQGMKENMDRIQENLKAL